MILEKDKIKIRNATEADVENLLTWWNDGNVMEHAGFPLGLNTTKDKVLKNIKSQNKERELLIIEFDGVAIGEMNYGLVSDDIAEIGIKICDFSKQNQGIGSKCLRLLIDYLFDIKKVQKIMLNTNLKNVRARHVYEKLGFTNVKEEVDSWKNQLGEPQSIVYYELKKKEWIGKIKPSDLWREFIRVHKEYENMEIPEDYYFCDNKRDADELAELVKNRAKTATSSLYLLYDLENEELPESDELSIITDFEGNAVAIINNTKVKIIPFSEVTEEMASKEGEGDRSLEYWRKVHKELFTKWLKELDMVFDESMKIVYESFEVLFTVEDYKKKGKNNGYYI